jgi:hypothetical protein
MVKTTGDGGGGIKGFAKILGVLAQFLDIIPLGVPYFWLLMQFYLQVLFIHLGGVL